MLKYTTPHDAEILLQKSEGLIVFGMTERRSWEYIKQLQPISYRSLQKERKFLTILTHLKNKIAKIQIAQAMPETTQMISDIQEKIWVVNSPGKAPMNL